MKTVKILIALTIFIISRLAFATDLSPLVLQAKALHSLNKSTSQDDNKKAESLKVLLGHFFSNTQCLSSKDQKKLNKALKNNKQGAIPIDILEMISQVGDEKIELAEAQTLRAMLHIYYRENEEKAAFLTGADSYIGLDPFLLIDTQKESFYYRLDCSAYLGSVLSSDIGFSSVKLESAVSAAFQKKEYYQASRAVMYSVLEKVMNPINTGGVSFNPESSSSILFPLFADLVSSGKAKFKTPEYMDIVSFERNSTRGLQGKLDVTGGAGFSFGLGGASLDINGGSSISETFRFHSPNSAIISLGPYKEYTLNQVKNSLNNSVEKIDLTIESVLPLIITSKMYPNLCINAGWKANINKKDNSSIASDLKVSSVYSSDGFCKFEIKTDGTILGGESVKINLVADAVVFSSLEQKPTAQVLYSK